MSDTAPVRRPIVHAVVVFVAAGISGAVGAYAFAPWSEPANLDPADLAPHCRETIATPQAARSRTQFNYDRLDRLVSIRDEDGPTSTYEPKAETGK